MLDMFDLSGKNAVIIGGAGGIGQAIARGIIEAGAAVAISSRKEESLQRAQAELKEATGQNVRYYVADACKEEEVEAVVERAARDMGRLDILVCAQGFNKKFPVHEFPADVFRSMMEANVTSVFLCCKHFGAHMMKNGYGKIIIVSSVRGKIASRVVGNVGYSTTKSAVDMLTSQIAAEYGPYGITVNAIGPTITETPMMSQLIEQRGGDAYRQSLAGNLLIKRMATPEDCVGSAVFLASPASDFMTGHTLYPDGGLTAVG